MNRFILKKIAAQLGPPLARLVQPYLSIQGQIKPIDVAANFVFAEAVPGDYLEFGTFKGASFIEAFHKCEAAFKRWNSKGQNRDAYSTTQKADLDFESLVLKGEMRYFAFDSFSGLPKISENDASHSRFREGRYDFSVKSFTDELNKSRVDLSKVVICPGYFEQSLTRDFKLQHHLTAASIVMIDCDLYESTRTVLEFITDLVQDGTILIFDDWFAFKGNPAFGEQRAVQEWLSANPDLRISPYHQWGASQKSFIVNKCG